jgi:hypothetical protein
MTPCRTGVAPVSNFELLFLNELFREANEDGPKQRKENFSYGNRRDACPTLK